MFLSSLASGLVSMVLLSMSAPPAPVAQAKPAAPAAQAQPAPKPPAAGRLVEITGTDDMKYSLTTIDAKPGETLRVRLTSKGVLPKMAMAHNFVLLKLGAKQIDFANAAAMARETDFIPPAMKDQVIAATGLAGAGETVEITFTVPKAPGSYPFMCTFPGHFATGMRGTLVVK